MWGLSDVKGRISIKIRDESIWHSALLSLCLAAASVGAGMSSVRPCLLCEQRSRCRWGGAQLARSALRFFRENLS